MLRAGLVAQQLDTRDLESQLWILAAAAILNEVLGGLRNRGWYVPAASYAA